MCGTFNITPSSENVINYLGYILLFALLFSNVTDLFDMICKIINANVSQFGVHLVPWSTTVSFHQNNTHLHQVIMFNDVNITGAKTDECLSKMYVLQIVNKLV